MTIQIPRGANLRCIVTWNASVPSGTHGFNVAVAYGKDKGNAVNDPTDFQIMAQANTSYVVTGTASNIKSNQDLTPVALAVGYYDAIILIMEPLVTPQVFYDWVVIHDAIQVVPVLGGEIVNYAFQII